MRFTLGLVTIIGFTFSISIWAQPGNCVLSQTPSDSGPRIEGTQMPHQEGQLVTSEDRDRFDREHPDLPQGQAGEIPIGDTSTPEEREAARRQFEVERQQHPEGRPREFFKPQHTTADQHRAKELARQKPCPQQKQ